MSQSHTTPDAPSLALEHHAALAVAEAIYEGEKLSLPPVPASLRDRWVQVAPTEFSSEPWPGHEGLYALDGVLSAILSGRLGCPFVAFGFAGHGLTSRAVHLYFATGQVIALIQMRWGTIFDDPEEDRKRYDYLMKECRKLDEAATAAAARGNFPPDRRLVVVQSSFTGGRWAWVSATTGESEIEWRRHGEISLFSALVEVQRLA